MQNKTYLTFFLLIGLDIQVLNSKKSLILDSATKPKEHVRDLNDYQHTDLTFKTLAHRVRWEISAERGTERCIVVLVKVVQWSCKREAAKQFEFV